MAIITKGRTRKEIPDSDIAEWSRFGWQVVGQATPKKQMELKAVVEPAKDIEKKDE